MTSLDSNERLVPRIHLEADSINAAIMVSIQYPKQKANRKRKIEDL
jgi:hypothetical protein